MLNPLAIAQLGIGRRPLLAALLGIWDKLMEELVVPPVPSSGGGSRPMRPRRRLAIGSWRPVMLPLPALAPPIEDEDALHLLGMI